MGLILARLSCPAPGKQGQRRIAPASLPSTIIPAGWQRAQTGSLREDWVGLVAAFNTLAAARKILGLEADQHLRRRCAADV